MNSWSLKFSKAGNLAEFDNFVWSEMFCPKSFLHIHIRHSCNLLSFKCSTFTWYLNRSQIHVRTHHSCNLLSLNVLLLHDILIAFKCRFTLITVVIFYLQMYCFYMMSKRACYFQYVKLLYSWRRSMILFWSKVGGESESWNLLNSMRW